MRVVVRSIPTAPKIHERALPITAILEDLERYGETAGMDDDGTLRVRQARGRLPIRPGAKTPVVARGPTRSRQDREEW